MTLFEWCIRLVMFPLFNNSVYVFFNHHDRNSFKMQRSKFGQYWSSRNGLIKKADSEQQFFDCKALCESAFSMINKKELA